MDELMDLKETYEFLLSPRRLADEIWRKDIRRQELRACLLPAAITYDKDRVQVTPEDHMAETMAEVADLDAEIEILQRRRARQIRLISKALDQLEDGREKAILEAYYIGRKSMNEIAEHMSYSLQHTYRLKRDGVENMRKMRNAYMV
jgi:DNA-directed RNA polymerase specialized sigma subunit